MLTLSKITEELSKYQTKNGREPGAVYLAPEVIRTVIDKVIKIGSPMNGPMTLWGIPLYPDFEIGLNKIRLAARDPEYGNYMRLSTFCHTMEVWARVAGQDLPGDNINKWGISVKQEERAKFREAWSIVHAAIQKSNLLARMFFELESVRRVPCPVHQGAWSGCVWDSPSFSNEKLTCVSDENPQGCASGANVTGWLPVDIFVETKKDDDGTGNK